MPIFEFICGECGHFFEELVRSTSPNNDIICPGCQSDQVKK
ncbi:MAG: zinc ribbon domain-containing protein [Anaerolineales bacterium]|nr:zinc ribbon domain-containing protein [Anaerolineales bacterium]